MLALNAFVCGQLKADVTQPKGYLLILMNCDHFILFQFYGVTYPNGSQYETTR